jgi:hypothetical protein
MKNKVFSTLLEKTTAKVPLSQKRMEKFISGTNIDVDEN